ncbi:hypothetical protein [Chryseobacterium cucumeris]|uniref:hypothetical protein n=1 Tax=Chryseobacterium cucumeris TaxID=1813611 RepID=UPI003D9A080E
MSKTVYFLGAGFSADAGGPIQNDIIKFVLSNEFKRCFELNSKVEQARNKFILFIEKDLYIPKDLWNNIALEDIFTPIDRAISNGKSFKGFDVKELVNLREEFHYLMGIAIHYGVDHLDKPKGYIYDFAKYINLVAKERLKGIENDNIAIITTNWDLLLDNDLNRFVRSFSDNEKTEGRNRLAVVDYCCYISSLDEDEFIKPGLLALGRNGYNIKYLKLHGSMNWLHCPSCQRMFIKYDIKTMLSSTDYHCSHCKRNYQIENSSSVKLNSNLLLPTFIKDLSNIQIQLVWQNAGIELAEATKVVFVGYSLPSADFEIRQLLSKCIPNHASVEIVIYPGWNNSKTEEELIEEKNWYKSFFGGRIKSDKNFIVKTVPEYVESLNINR